MDLQVQIQDLTRGSLRVEKHAERVVEPLLSASSSFATHWCGQAQLQESLGAFKSPRSR